jgi:hypothetical protein
VIVVKLLYVAVLTLLAGSLVSCTHVRPWERGKLAHPTMTTMDPGPAAEHLYSVQEGAAGGGASAASGCGCN